MQYSQLTTKQHMALEILMKLMLSDDYRGTDVSILAMDSVQKADALIEALTPNDDECSN